MKCQIDKKATHDSKMVSRLYLGRMYRCSMITIIMERKMRDMLSHAEKHQALKLNMASQHFGEKSANDPTQIGPRGRREELLHADMQAVIQSETTMIIVAQSAHDEGQWSRNIGGEAYCYTLTSNQRLCRRRHRCCKQSHQQNVNHCRLPCTCICAQQYTKTHQYVFQNRNLQYFKRSPPCTCIRRT